MSLRRRCALKGVASFRLLSLTRLAASETFFLPLDFFVEPLMAQILHRPVPAKEKTERRR